MSEKAHADIAGTLVCIEILARQLESEGSLTPGGFRNALQEHLESVPEIRRKEKVAFYGPMAGLIAALDKGAPVARPKN